MRASIDGLGHCERTPDSAKLRRLWVSITRRQLEENRDRWLLTSV